MKKVWLLTLLVLGFSYGTAAQTHSVTLSWSLSVPTGTSAQVASQNVYRALCTGTVTAGVCSTDSTATFTKLAAGTGLGPTVATFTDSTVLGVTNYIYYLTAVGVTTTGCAAPCESIPSGHVAAAVPGATPPPPPSGLSITNVAMTVVGPNDRLQVDWKDTSGATTAFTIFGGQGQVLKQASQQSSIGVYSYAIQFPPQSGSISICDNSTCVTQAFQAE